MQEEKSSGNFRGIDRRQNPVLGNRTPLSDNQRRILTAFEKRSKEWGCSEEYGTEGPTKTRVKSAFDKARAEMWGMVTAMRRGLVETASEVERQRKGEKVRLAMYDHAETDSGAMVAFDVGGRVVELEFMDEAKAASFVNIMASVLGMTGSPDNGKDEKHQWFEGELRIMKLEEVKLVTLESPK
jgi:hypothetical protein